MNNIFSITLFFALSLYMNNAEAQSFYFNSGFENSTVLNQYELNGNINTNYADIYGADNISGYDWEVDLDDLPNIGSFRVYYEVGDTLKAKASIVSDPLDNSNKVLKFKLDSANVPNSGSPKGRIQASINGNTNLKEFSFKLKLYIHPDLDTLRFYNGTFNWFTLMEFWNNGAFQPYPFRITLNIQKPDTPIGSNLYFGTHAQTKDTSLSVWNNVWSDLDTTYSVPTGEWLTFETYFYEGDSLNGKYKVAVTDSMNNTHVLFDISDYTHHPNDPLPDGVTNFNPMKLYTSGLLIDGMTSLNSELSVYWDDFEFSSDPLLTIIDNFKKEDLILFPNPFTDVINIKAYQNIETVCIYNLFGQLIKECDYSDNKPVNVNHLTSGVYIVVVELANKTLNKYKLIKM